MKTINKLNDVKAKKARRVKRGRKLSHRHIQVLFMHRKYAGFYGLTLLRSSIRAICDVEHLQNWEQLGPASSLARKRTRSAIVMTNGNVHLLRTRYQALRDDLLGSSPTAKDALGEQNTHENGADGTPPQLRRRMRATKSGWYFSVDEADEQGRAVAQALDDEKDFEALLEIVRANRPAWLKYAADAAARKGQKRRGFDQRLAPANDAIRPASAEARSDGDALAA
ncbi:MAG: hypothetical protein JSS75_04105 [Bacteroidetes bacterium]|nr:hypothetical protein [Bacteroidota bacterium]